MQTILVSFEQGFRVEPLPKQWRRGGANIHIFVSTDHKNNRFQNKLIMQNTKIRIFAPPPIIELEAPLYLRKRKICKPIDSAGTMSPWLPWEPYNCPRPRVSVFLPVSLPLPAAVNDKYYKNFASVHAYLLQKFCLFMNTQGRRSHGGSGANCPRCPNIAGAARGQQVALFARTASRNLCIIHRNWNLELFLSNV